VIIKLEGGHVIMPAPHAVNLVELLERVAEVLRYGCDDLFTDSEGDLFVTSCANDRLIKTVEQHTQMLRAATKPRSLRANAGPIP
jgi:hypothetical protein